MKRSKVTDLHISKSSSFDLRFESGGALSIISKRSVFVVYLLLLDLGRKYIKLGLKVSDLFQFHKTLNLLCQKRTRCGAQDFD